MDHLPTPRIAAVDLVRTAALAGMVLFHFVFDLQMFGHLPPGTVAMPGPWAILARIVAGSFLFVAGVSLMLAHGDGIRRRSFLRRLAILAAAAAAITLGSRVFLPDEFIFFGILHAIAVFSVLGLAFLRLPTVVILAAAFIILVLPQVWTGPLFGTPWLVWIGLAPTPPLSMDFEPLFPWFAPFLAGMASTRIARCSPLWPALGRPPGTLVQRLAWPGRHSLPIYLLHQPVLLGAVWLFSFRP
jgi:uncharacterized membrane protein